MSHNLEVHGWSTHQAFESKVVCKDRLRLNKVSAKGETKSKLSYTYFAKCTKFNLDLKQGRFRVKRVKSICKN